MYQSIPHRPLSAKPPNPARRFRHYWDKAKPDEEAIRRALAEKANRSRVQDYDYEDACICCGKMEVPQRLRRQYLRSCYLCGLCFDRGWRLRQTVKGRNYSPTNIDLFNRSLRVSFSVATLILEQH